MPWMHPPFDLTPTFIPDGTEFSNLALGWLHCDAPAETVANVVVEQEEVLVPDDEVIDNSQSAGASAAKSNGGSKWRRHGNR